MEPANAQRVPTHLSLPVPERIVYSDGSVRELRHEPVAKVIGFVADLDEDLSAAPWGFRLEFHAGGDGEKPGKIQPVYQRNRPKL